MGITLGIFICLGTMPVSNDLFMSFSNLVDILSWLQLNFGFNLVATDKTTDGATGSINTLSTTGLDMYDENVLFEFGTLWLVLTPILGKKLLKPSAASCLSVIDTLLMIKL